MKYVTRIRWTGKNDCVLRRVHKCRRITNHQLRNRWAAHIDGSDRRQSLLHLVAEPVRSDAQLLPGLSVLPLHRHGTGQSGERRRSHRPLRVPPLWLVHPHSNCTFKWFVLIRMLSWTITLDFYRYFVDTNTIDTLHIKISMFRYFDNLFHQTPTPYVNFVRRVQKVVSP